MVRRQAGCCKVVGIFILNGIHFSHKQKKETHFDYNAEDDTIEQWFSNLSLLRATFPAFNSAAEPFALLSIITKSDWAVSQHEHLNRPGVKRNFWPRPTHNKLQ